MTTTSNLRSLVKADAVFEATLGLVLLVGGVSSSLTRSDIPLSRGLIIASGASFLLASASQLLYFVRAPHRVLLLLAVGNAAMAVAGLIWLIADRGFSAAGLVIVAAAVAWKTVISSMQLRAARHTRSGPATAT
jgi:hypothetical protein